VLVALLEENPAMEVTALIRKHEDGPKLQSLLSSLKTIVGKMEDLDLISAQCRDADLVLSAVNCDDVPLIQAIIKGLEERAASGVALKPALIHTSGTGVTEVGSDGNFMEGPVYDVGSVISILTTIMLNTRPRTPIPPPSSRSLQRMSIGPWIICNSKKHPSYVAHTDSSGRIFAAHARGSILTYIVAPSAVYGRGRGPCGTTCNGNHFWTLLALKHGGAPVVNEGTAVWSDIHIDDLVDLYMGVFNRALKEGPSSVSARAPAPLPEGGDLPDSAYEYETLHQSRRRILNSLSVVSTGLLPSHTPGVTAHGP
jgi:hypothetical protein